MSHHGSQEAPQAGASPLPPAPAMPIVPGHELYRGTPRLVLESDLRHSVGWQVDRKAGPSFVVARLSRMSTIKVKERFPLTEQGWDSAWRALSDLDATAATAVAVRLAEQAESRRAAAAWTAVGAESLCSLRHVIFNGGSGATLPTKDQAYDVLFGSDRVMVCPLHSARAIIEVPYGNVEAVEVGGPGLVGKPPGEIALLAAGLALLGGLLGLLVLGLLGLLLGALIFGAVGALIGNTSTKIETLVQIRTSDSEFYFLHNEVRPEALRIEMSEALRVIQDARNSQSGSSNKRTELASESIPDQLVKLASLVKQGMVTRDEFDRLKARLIAES